MIPVFLEMNAFGSYAAKQIIDFRLLGDRKLFLIYGPTGAGKTTILDAICYALYGDTSGNIRTGNHMRSEYALPEETTYVNFSFDIGTKHYRIERMPEQMIAKKRGTGLKHAASAATLYELGENGEDIRVIATKNVNDEIVHLLGFKSEQFRQVVLLPQGDFRKLLLASSSDRQQIMQTLFHTQRYARLQALAKERHDAIAESYSTIQERIAITLQSIKVEDEKELEVSAKRLELQVKSSVDALHKAVTTRDSYQKIVQQAQVLDSHWKALEQSRQCKLKLDGQKKAIDQQRDYADTLRRAQLLAEPCRHVDEIQTQGMLAGKKAAAASAETIAADAKLLAARQDYKKLEDMDAAQKSRTEKLARLQSMGEKASAYGALAENADKAEKEAAVANDKLTGLTRQWEERKKQIAAGQETLNHQPELMSAWERTKAQVTSLKERLRLEKSIEALAQMLDKSEKDIVVAAELLKTATHKARADRVDYEAVHALFLQGQAALLAAQLDEGEACPVCGATSHPKLASTPEGMPQKEDVERRKVAADDSEKKRQQAEVQATSAQSAWQEQQRQYTDLRQHSPAEGTSSDWQQRLNQAAKEELLLQRQVQDMKNLAQRMILLQKEEHDLDEAQQRSRHDAETSRLAMARAVEAKVRAEADIPEPYRKAGTLKQDIAILKKAIQEYDANLIKTRQVVVEAERSSARLKGIEKELNRQVEDLRHQYTTSIEALKERVVAAGFASVTECRKIQSDIPRLGEIQEAIDGYDKELQQIQGQINQEEIAVNNMPKPDMETYHKHLADLNTQCSAAAEEEARLTNQLKQLTEAAKRIAQWRSEQEDLSEQYKTIGNVYDLISGKNTGVNFERYVLGALLDEVLAAANQRLDKMSRQRYQLQRSHNWEDKRVRQIGLDIEVYDNYTGNTRPASTLSGGETFLASLSLALGLADVVQTYSGGIHLDTIFIDEGFGTLDSEALDYALQSLLELQQGGRLVGIISHVPELRERIDTRLAITKTDRGSTAAFELN